VATETLAAGEVWEARPDQIPVEAGDESWQVKIEKA
jgi:hypothetical protein